ncbi:hypothetical protein CB1_001679010 [Camelus ferus]|nr:hypothetical protein CB1_001679010 [Camelus ferus]
MGGARGLAPPLGVARSWGGAKREGRKLSGAIASNADGHFAGKLSVLPHGLLGSSTTLHSPRPHKLELKEQEDQICTRGPLSCSFQTISKEAVWGYSLLCRFNLTVLRPFQANPYQLSKDFDTSSSIQKPLTLQSFHICS